MHPVVYYIFFFLAIGAAGMAAGSRKVSPAIRKQRWLKYFTYIFFTGVVVLGIFYDFLPWVAGLITSAALAELWIVNTNAKQLSRTVMFFSLLLCSIIATGFILFTITFNYSFLIFIYFQVMVFDGFCQITGQLLGRHQLAPAVSPSKTWEGLLGGLLFCVGVAMASSGWVGLPFYKGAVLGLVTGGAGFAGDMLASWYKRKVGVKDYSNWLPGQGGFLDRFDSFLVTGCAYFIGYSLIFKNALMPFIRPL